ncbi:type VI secretion system Vgr family protein [Inquilinus sp. Marseille-Q2685]|uniref:type VI secretion system Vgr family protein n=1 Tax=Inquilinus sp. Marseille-Q2685 TaxID=2866581 RepID=UPI001CE3B792|nr:type VI secretion system tip protein TssI/VgrG [Inquilinus sp. Marseille-Q2685]
MSPYDYVGSLTQSGRLLAIRTPLGEDVFLLEAMEGVEEVCELFSFRLRVRSKRTDVKADELVGRPVSWSLELPGGERRWWSGVVGALEVGHPVGDGLRSYSLVVHPWLWLFGHTSDCRIFQNQTTQQILETIFQEAGIRDWDFGAVTGPKAVRPYCVQYNETDLAFVFRLLEEEGWAWWFRHEAGEDGAGARQVLVVSDGAHAWTEDEAEPEIRYTSTGTDLNDVKSWARHYAFKPGRVAEAEWNFETPSAPVLRDQPSTAPIATGEPFEMYRWGGRFLDKERADHVTRRRIETHEAGFETIEATSGNRRIHPGRRFRLYGHPLAEENGEYAVTAVRHRAVDTTYVGAGGQSAPTYENGFAVVPAKTRWVPEQRTPHPRIDGVQSAVVVGPPGEEIFTDPYGRIQVRFPWDRRAKGRDGDSCWLRVSQPWGGRGWGAQTIPRIGMEVLVAYYEGDPDKPMVVGVVPNPDKNVPYELPANKTKSVFRTNTHKGTGFNELTFEDEKGREDVYLHAQKDFTTKIRNHKTERVDANHVQSVGGASVREVQRSDVHNVGQNMSVNVGTGPAGDLVRGALAQHVFGVRSAGYFIDSMLPLMNGFGNYTVNASSAISFNAIGGSFHTTGGPSVVTVGLDQVTTVGGTVRVSAGEDSHEIASKRKVLEAHQEVLIRCGKSELRMTPDGTIVLKGTNLIVEEEQKMKVTAPRIELN